MKPQSHRDMEIKKSGRAKSETIVVCLFVFSLCLCVSVTVVLSSAYAEQTSAPAAQLEGCLKCHDKIEPMHRFGQTVTLDTLDHGKDAQGLTCTACHGGNPTATTKEEAHVHPRFPREWMRDGKFRIPERSGPLLVRESHEFVRFIN